MAAVARRARVRRQLRPSGADLRAPALFAPKS
jgi:hypothetical protein